MSNPNDVTRHEILKYLYELRSKVKGPKGVAVTFRELQTALKEQKFKQADIVSNLDYLEQKGWVKRDLRKSKYSTPSGFVKENETATYKISADGIDRMERASAFNRQETYSGINITNINGVTVLGSGNVVNTQFTDLSRALDELKDRISSSKLDEENKLNAIADVSTIQDQISKPKPNVGIVKQAWEGLDPILKIAGLMELGTQIYHLLGPLLGLK